MVERFEYEAQHMGVGFRLTFYAASEAAAKAAADAAFRRIDALDDTLSDWEPESELSRLSSNAAGTWIPVSEDLGRILERAMAFASASGGAFDPTVGPLVKLWREARRTRVLPDAGRLAAARAAAGWRRLELDTGRRAVRLLVPGMSLDLGGIAKGFAADEALRVLAAHGIDAALCAAAGDVAAGAPPPGTAGWRVGIAPAFDPDAPPERHLLLARAAVSTSGDAYQSVEIDGRRYSHIVDPRTGLGLTTRASVTVVAASGLEADALATAACVLGPDAGLALVDGHPGSAASFTWRDGDRQLARESPAFAAKLDRGGARTR